MPKNCCTPTTHRQYNICTKISEDIKTKSCCYNNYHSWALGKFGRILSFFVSLMNPAGLEVLV